MKKITYATMSGDALDDLHRELDVAIDRVKSTFGRSYPLVIGGHEVRAASEFDDRSPIDTRILLVTFQSASREQTREAIEAGADYIGIGRPITAHAQPREAAARILDELTN